MLATAALAAFLFASTDIDDLLLLVVLFADSRLRPAQIAAGQFLGVTGLFLASLVLSRVAQIAPREALGWLGLVPIAIGVKTFLRDEDEEEGLPAGSGVFAVAAVTLANGGDNLAAYTPVFALRGPAEIAVMALAFAAMTALWLALAHRLVRRSALGEWIRRVEHCAVPAALTALGVSILLQAGSLRPLVAALRPS